MSEDLLTTLLPLVGELWRACTSHRSVTKLDHSCEPEGLGRGGEDWRALSMKVWASPIMAEISLLEYL